MHIKSDYFCYIPPQEIERLKQAARKLKKAQKIPHSQALEMIAQEKGFNHWHEVTEIRKSNILSENALKNGVVLVYTWSDAWKEADAYFKKYRCNFQRDYIVPFLCRDFMFDRYCNFMDEDLDDWPTGKTLIEAQGIESCQEEFEMEFEPDEHYGFFIFTGKSAPKTAKGVLGKLNKYQIYQPDAFFVNGAFYERDSYTGLFRSPPFNIIYPKNEKYEMASKMYGVKYDPAKYSFPNKMILEKKPQYFYVMPREFLAK